MAVRPARVDDAGCGQPFEDAGLATGQRSDDEGGARGADVLRVSAEDAGDGGDERLAGNLRRALDVTQVALRLVGRVP